MTPRVRNALAALVIVVATLAAYARAPSGDFLWDDGQYVVHNETLRTADGLRRIWLEPRATPQYYPLVHTGFWLEYRAWGLEPFGYHLTNLLLHALGALLAWRVLDRLGVPGAWLAGALFALHPVHVESVAWITERKNVLSGVFYLGSALAYLRVALPDEPAEPPSVWAYALSLLLFGAALLSKTVTASLPAALLLVVWWKRGRIGGADLAPLAPFFALGLALGLHTAWLEQTHVGASGEEWSLSAAERLLVAGRAVWFYAGSLVWPVDLTFVYPRWSVDSSDPVQWLYPVWAALVVVLLYAFRGRIGRGPLVGVLFFGGTLVPALGFLNVYPHRFSFVADHFQYLASLGVLALIAAGGTLGARAVSDRMGSIPGRAAAAVLLATLALLTWRQTAAYQDRESLWRDTLTKNPDAWIAHNNLGTLLEERGDLEQAIAHFERVVALKPDHANAFNNLGYAHWGLGDSKRAAEFYQRALAIDPDHADAHTNLGTLLVAHGVHEAALAHFSAAVIARPEDPEVRYNLAITLARTGRMPLALPHLRRVVEQTPDAPAPLSALAWVLSEHPNPELRDTPEAVRLARRAVVLDGRRDAGMLVTLAGIYGQVGAERRASDTARMALAIAVRNGDADAAASARRLLARYPGAAPETAGAAEPDTEERESEDPLRGAQD